MNQLKNTECPICLEEFKLNDDVKYGCDSKHLHHEKCFDDMLAKNKYLCSICRIEAQYINDRQFYPCACLSTNNVSENDSQLQCWSLFLPILYPLGFLILPCIELELCITCCCTKTILIEDNDSIVSTKIIENIS